MAAEKYEPLIHAACDRVKFLLPDVYKRQGVKPVEEGFDMIPHAQCFNGGIEIDRTDVYKRQQKYDRWAV